MKQPLLRPAIYDLYWRFAAERQAIFERRLAGQAAPWTDDPILATYKFCNVFRASDRISQYLLRDVAYAEETASAADTLFRTVAFRLFSRSETWDEIVRHLERQPTIDDLMSGAFEASIHVALTRQGKLYTGAFILSATPSYGYREKYRNHVALLRHMFASDDLATKLQQATSLAEIYALLRAYPLIGNFMAYQIAIDLNYTSYINFDEDDFTQAGPGALRGIAKAFVARGDSSPESIIRWMVDHQEEEFARLNLRFNGLFGRRLHAIDCQGLFCEFDKYCREAAPELPSNRSRIKARYQQSGRRRGPLFFPPKWGLNDRLDPKTI